MDKFAFFPSNGASSGLLTVWNSSYFDGNIIQANSYAITVKMLNKLDNRYFQVSNIYGPSQSAAKQSFITWLMNLDTSKFDDWIMGGDFNLIRHPKNRNKPGGELSEMNMFNELITDLDLVEVPFSGRSFTWSNMQADRLLVKLDWVFTSSSWSVSYPATYVQPLPKPMSDHIPYNAHVGSSIPKCNMFRFENFWVNHPGFMDTVNLHWNNAPFYANAARNMSAKLKQVRAGLKSWSKNLSKLSKLIYNCNWVLLLVDGLEDQRPLSILERHFKKLVKSHLANLLESKRLLETTQYFEMGQPW